MKINIVGTTASGKSTFGRTLADKIGVPFIEMDAIFWGPNWQEPPDDEFYKNIEAALKSSSWVLDGNYETFRRMFSSDSIILWCLRNYSKNRIRYLNTLSDPQYSHIQFVHLRSPTQAKEYIESVAA